MQNVNSQNYGGYQALYYYKIMRKSQFTKLYRSLNVVYNWSPDAVINCNDFVFPILCPYSVSHSTSCLLVRRMIDTKTSQPPFRDGCHGLDGRHCHYVGFGDTCHPLHASNSRFLGDVSQSAAHGVSHATTAEAPWALKRSRFTTRGLLAKLMEVQQHLQV